MSLEIQNLSYHTGNRHLLSQIDLSFETGALYGILGPNGSGKSTLLRCIAGIWDPTEGQVLWKSSDLHSFDRRAISQIVSLVPQNTHVLFDFTVYDFVAMGRYPHTRSKIQTTAESTIIQNALETIDALDLSHRYMTELSQGERQRIFIARALVTESPVLLLDEPTANLDIKHQLEIWRLCRDLARLGKVVLVASHDLPNAERFCDSIALIQSGCCVEQGACQDVLTPDRISDIFGVKKENVAEYSYVLN